VADEDWIEPRRMRRSVGKEKRGDTWQHEEHAAGDPPPQICDGSKKNFAVNCPGALFNTAQFRVKGTNI